MASSRSRVRYRHKGRRKTVIKTVMGEVEYQISSFFKGMVTDVKNEGIRNRRY